MRRSKGSKTNSTLRLTSIDLTPISQRWLRASESVLGRLMGARDPQVTVANHTYQHDLAALSHDAVRAKVERAHAHFTRQMGAPARSSPSPSAA
ncbi:hypothetical protein ABT255_50595 [Streptomyces mirabilis]|uniref:hypothetical protein n=1 Tax=Streptomyces mirabilis TaxID=68239 RepID=UPI00332CABEE